ncbi:MAG: efflux RND transporter permease subunit [Acidobacteria bacterium]|nr:MAG: efflux RND transporter permease subunit [Acidobacteriota bacterium]
MKLADVSIGRPVFAFMMSIALVVLGLFSYRDLGLDLMPKTDYPLVFVSTQLPGASAEEIESQISKPIEEVVNSISGIDELRSMSDQGSSRVMVTFNLEKDIDVAVQEVRDKVAGIVSRFPRDTLPSVINKVDPDASPILTVAVSGERSPKEITEIVDKQIKQVLETVKDVGDVTFQGDRRREIQLLLNADRLNAYGLTVDQVRAAVQRQNVEIPGGTFIAGSSEIALRTMGRIQKVEDFNRIILAYRNGATVTFGDVGRVLDTVEEPRSLARLNDQTAISLQIRKQSGTNTVAVVDAIMARLERIKPTLPPDIKIQTIRDQSRFIRKSVEDIQHHLILGGLLASLVVFLFIRNLRSTVIAAVAIPTSIIGTFTIMKALGFTLNNMTMLALSLATGIVIDDAIVVLENIFRYIEEKGMAPKKAAAMATNEIGLAVMATTLSLVVIFLPVAFMTGQVGRYFYSFGIASAAAILISMFVSFTLTPALCSVLLKPGVGGHAKQSKSRGVYAAMDRGYGHMLSWSLHHRLIMLGIAAAVSVSAVLLFPRIGKELVPDDDQSEFGVNVRMPRGTSFARTDEYTREVEAVVKKLPEVRDIFTTINGNRVEIWAGMTPLEERSISQQAVMRQARVVLSRFTGARISVTGGTDISGASTTGGRGGGSTNRLYLLIQGREIDQLQTYVMDLITRVKTIPGLVDVDTNFEATQPELRINIDRARAADLGVTIDSLASSMRLLVGGEEVSKYKEGDEQYEVRLRLDEPFRNNPEGINELLIPSSTQGTVKVSDVAALRLEPGPASIDRYNRQRQVTLFANLDNIPLGEAITAARAKVDELNLKPGYQAVFGASARTFSEASNDFVIAILLAVAFIYMVLASQFNSFIHPLTIMTALPLSVPAGLLTLLAFDRTLNVYSAIGLMMLFGVVKKNSILQVDYTNTLRAQGMERHEALIAANHVRLRPILMTTISIIAGMVPIALGRGSGAGSRSSMALTIIGGQILCLLLTLLITPVVYSYFDDLREWRSWRVFQRLRREPEPTPVAEPVMTE